MLTMIRLVADIACLVDDVWHAAYSDHRYCGHDHRTTSVDWTGGWMFTSTTRNPLFGPLHDRFTPSEVWAQMPVRYLEDDDGCEGCCLYHCP